MNTEQRIPLVGLGTYGLTGDAGTAAILQAIEIGYRALDTAQTYDTEAQVGQAVVESGLDRSDIFLTTKITPENFSDLRASMRKSCDTMQVDAVDLTLIHWPAPNDSVPVADYIGELAQAQADGQTRLIGVSNFTRAHLAEAEAVLGKGKLATNQFECHAYLQNRILTAHCESLGVQVTAYMPLAQGRLPGDPVLTEIGNELDVEASQVGLAYLLHKGYGIIPKSANPGRMQSNFAASEISLSPAQVTRIDALERGERIINPDWGPDWD